MRARRGQPDQDVAGAHALREDELGLFGDADAEARQVIVPLGVHPGHLGRLAPREGATGQLAALGDARDDRGGDLQVQPPARVIVEEE
jgi:hypothetical protein